jgi:serine/threonine-protein kinase
VASAVARFRREIEVVGRIRSPHCIRFLESGVTEQGRLYIAMERLQGETLRSLLERYPRPAPRTVVGIVGQIASALSEVHGKGVLHRDLKPENVFLCADGPGRPPVAKVLDFGLARLAAAGGHGASSLVDGSGPLPRITAPGTTVGTPAYLAPELAMKGRTATHQSDLYSLGVMAFELLTGRRPFTGKTPATAMLAHLRDPIPSACALRASLPATVDGFFVSALAKDPAARPADAAAFAMALGAALPR